jgi:membrane protein YqaA with SNARE-associated domain
VPVRAVSGAVELFASAFLAATLLPVSSEAILAYLGTAEGADAVGLVAVATAGNTLGAIVNWVLGRWCLHWRERLWFPIKPAALDRATGWMERGGLWLLLLAWVPVVGDPLTFAAGMLRVRFLPFTVLVALGKGARYVAVLAVARWAVGG